MAATGTGLPQPNGAPVLATPSPSINADSYSSAAAWTKIADAGTKIAHEGFDTLQRDAHLRQAGAVADFEVAHADWYTKAKDQYYGDPVGYENAARAHNDGAMSELPTWMVPHATKYLNGKLEGGLGTQLSVKRSEDDRLATQSLDARLKMAEGDLVGLAAAGKVGTPEFEAAKVTYLGIRNTQVQTRVMAPEQADFLTDETMGKVEGEVAGRSAVQIFHQQNYEAAVRHLQTGILENDQLSLKPESKQRAFNAGMRALNIEKQLETQDRGVILDGAKDLSARINSGQPYDNAEVEDMASSLGRVRATAQQSKLVVDHAVRRETEGLDMQGLAVATANNRAATADAKLTGAVKKFEGFVPKAQWDYKQYTNGYGTKALNPNEVIDQATAETRLNNEVSKAAAIVDGVNPNLPPGVKAALTSLTFNAGGGWADSGLGASIRAGDFEKAKTQFVQYNKAGGAVNPGLVNRRAAEVQWFDSGGPSGGSAVDASGQSGQITRRVQQTFVAQARKTWAELKPQIDAGKPIEDADLNAVHYAAALSNDAAWIKQTQELVAARQLGAQATSVPMAQGQAFVDEVRQNFSDRVYKSVQSQYDRKNKLVQDDPISYAIESGRSPPRAINMANPADFKASLVERAALVQGVANTEGIAPGSAFRKSELPTVTAALDVASPDTKIQLFSAMAGALPEPVYRKTMEGLGDNNLTQFVGMVARDRPELAREILHGQELRKIEKTGDKSSLVIPAFQDKIGRDLYPSAADQNNVTNAAMAVYTARRGSAGALYDPTDSTGIGKAIEDVAGKIVKHNGMKVAVPPGMAESAFTGALSDLTFEKLAKFGGAFDRQGLPFNGQFISDRAVLKQMGPGESNYLVAIPNAAARDGISPVMTSEGRPLVIDVKQLAAERVPAPLVSTAYQAGRSEFKTLQAQQLQDARRQSLEAP